jgi:hypothetical protein
MRQSHSLCFVLSIATALACGSGTVGDVPQSTNTTTEPTRASTTINETSAATSPASNSTSSTSAPRIDESTGTAAAPISRDPEPVNSLPTTPDEATEPTPEASSTLDAIECPSYDQGFLPGVVEPVCGNCHGVRRGLPNFEPFASAASLCTTIGREVASGSMPPQGSLSADQRNIVLNWVGLGCPESAADAAAACTPASGPNAPGTPGTVPPGNGSGANDDDDDGDEDGDDDDDGDNDDDDDGDDRDGDDDDDGDDD